MESQQQEKISIIEAYQKLITEIPQLIKEQGRTQIFIYTSLNWSREKWRLKKKKGDFSPEELKMILSIVFTGGYKKD